MVGADDNAIRFTYQLISELFIVKRFTVSDSVCMIESHFRNKRIVIINVGAVCPEQGADSRKLL